MGILQRWKRWLRYRRILAAAVTDAESKGYDISPPAYERLREEARRQAG